MSRIPVPGEESEHDHGFHQRQPTFPGTIGDQWQKDANGIIRFLDMVELDCVEANKDYAKELHTMSEWDALFFLHRMLHDKHHNLFLLSVLGLKVINCWPMLRQCLNMYWRKKAGT